jgi:hydroxymethylpyrimidine kinase / phosphomethylpyrimidine kinase / thiamine-phosphate diphosphorylase
MKVLKPIIWSIAGNDSAGGAGLSADQRAADACEVHLCPVVSAITAQHSRGVNRVEAVSTDMLNAQLQALAADMPPRVIKTGLLGSADNVRTVAQWVDKLRAQHDVVLVVDPVLGSTTGKRFTDSETLRAYQTELLPRASLIAPNRSEAIALLGGSSAVDLHDIPAQARRLHDMGAQAVCITGGDSIAASHASAASPASTAQAALAIDWMHTAHASGWLALPQVNTAHHHGTGCTFATSASAAMARGFVAADALVLAKMATAPCLRSRRWQRPGACEAGV